MASKKPAQDKAGHERQTPESAEAENRHNDWGHEQGGNVQSGARGNIGGVAGSQHNDWGHSPVATRAPGPAGRPRQGVMPGEEMGHLRRKTDK